MKIRRKIMIPLCFGLIILAGVFVWNDGERRAREVEANLNRSAAVVEKLIGSELRADVAIMETALGSFTKDPETIRLFTAQNRDRLAAHSFPAFERLKKNWLITHFYFHRLDRRNFLRLHELDHFDDRIERETLKSAAETGLPSSGVEQGPTGASVLRVVFPIQRGNERVGYLELGKEFQDIVAKIERIVSAHAFVLADKSRVDRAKWEKRNNKASFKASWDFLNEQVVMASSLPSIPEELRSIRLDSRATGAYVMNGLEVRRDGRFENVFVVPYRDDAGRKVADIVLLHDSSSVHASSRRTAILTFGSALAMVLAMLGFFHAFLGKVEDLIAKQQQQIVSSSKLASLGEMAGGVAHEINTPLAAIKNLSGQLQEVIDEEPLDRNLLKEMSAKIEGLTDRIARIVQGLRWFSHDRSNESFQPVGVRPLIEETLSLCQERFKSSGTRLIVDEIAGDLEFSGRSTEVSQVLLNLLNNAYDAISDRKEKWIRVSARNDREWIELRVADSGPGIPEEVRKKIFQPFFTTKEIGKGTGMGLSISMGIVRAHGGELSVDVSAPTTCFVVRLPRLRTESASRTAA